MTAYRPGEREGRSPTRRSRTERHDERERGLQSLLFAGVLFGLALSSVLTAASGFTGGWLLPAAGLVAVMVLTGYGVRQVTRSSFNGRVTAWWLQAGVAIVMLLGLQATRSDLSLSPWQVVQAFGENIGDGIGNILWYHEVPIVVGDTVLPTILSAVGLIVLLNDLVMRVVRLPGLAAAWLFLPMAVPLQLPVETSIGPIIAVAVLFAIALMLSSTRGRRLRGPALAALATVTAVVVALPLLLPNPRDVGATAPDWLTQEGAGVFPPAVPLLSTDIDLAANLKRPEAVDVLEYTTSYGAGTYLQLTTLGDVSQGGFTELPEGTAAPGLGDLPAAYPPDAEVNITSLGLRSDTLPVPPGLPKELDTGIEYEFDPVTESYALSSSRDRIPEGAEWTSTGGSRAVINSRVQVSGPFGSAPEPGVPLTELPAELGALEGMAAEIVAGSDGTDFDMLVHLIDYFGDDSWQYSEEIPFAGFGNDPDGQWDALLDFMQARVGYCVHYATAFAALARALDIPSRVSIGFLPGLMSGGVFTVTTNDMHAWAEVYIQDIGWVIVDVTPPVLRGQLQASDVGDNPFGPNGTEPTAFEPSETPSDSSAAPTPSASDPTQTPSDVAEPSLAPDASGGESSPSPSSSGEAADDEPQGLHPGWIIMLVLLLAVLLPMAARGGQRLAHLRGGAAGAWREIVASAVDAGVEVPTHATPRLAIEAMSSRLSDDGMAAAQRMRAAAEADAFGPPGTAAPLTDEARADAELVSRELWRRVRGPEALWRRMLPVSLLPEPLRSKQT